MIDMAFAPKSGFANKVRQPKQSRAGTVLTRRSEAHRGPYLPGCDLDSTHSADVDYAELVPSLFELKVENCYMALAGEQDGRQVLDVIRKHLIPDQRIFVGVITPIDRYIEAPEEVRVRWFAAWQPDGGAWLP
jgi:hypothetical protein